MLAFTGGVKLSTILFCLLLAIPSLAAAGNKPAAPPEPAWSELESLLGLGVNDPRVRTFRFAHGLLGLTKPRSGRFWRNDCSFSLQYDWHAISLVTICIKKSPNYGSTYKGTLPFDLKPSDYYSKVERKLGTSPVAYFPKDRTGWVTKLLPTGNQFRVLLVRDQIIEIAIARDIPRPEFHPPSWWTLRRRILCIPLAVGLVALPGSIIRRKQKEKTTSLMNQ